MENENLNEIQAQGGDADYISAIEELKANSVPRDEYNKLVEEKKRLLNSLVNGSQEAAPVPKESAAELRNKLYATPFLNNYDYWDTTLKLRKAILEEGGEDPFVPKGKSVSATQLDYDGAQRVANIVQECLDYSNGDSDLFTNELMRRTRDSVPAIKRK